MSEYDAEICIDAYLRMLRRAEMKAKEENGKSVVGNPSGKKYEFMHLKNTI